MEKVTETLNEAEVKTAAPCVQVERLVMPSEFRKNLMKVMPGYSWTVHKSSSPGQYLDATGIQTSGFNRCSTIHVIVRRAKDGTIEYHVKSSGFGLRAPWLATAVGGTLARSLRALQTDYEDTAANYQSHAAALKRGRMAA